MLTESPEFKSSNNTERFVAHLVALGQEKQAVIEIHRRTTRSLRRTQGRQKRSDKKRQYEAKESSNKTRMKLEGWTEDPKVVSNAFWNATPAVTEASMKVKEEKIVKQEDELEIGTAAKAESQTKVGVK